MTHPRHSRVDTGIGLGQWLPGITRMSANGADRN